MLFYMQNDNMAYKGDNVTCFCWCGMRLALMVNERGSEGRGAR